MSGKVFGSFVPVVFLKAITAGESGVAGRGDGGSIWEIGSGVVSTWVSISAGLFSRVI